MILILGKGDLASAIKLVRPDAICVGRPEYDLTSQADCDRLIADYSPTVVINTVAVNQTHNAWELLTVNFTAAVYITLGFYEKMTQGQIINISSASTLWVSYPDIPTGRFCYNLSKDALSNFGRHFNRKIVDHSKNIVVSTIEVGKFPSKFNSYQSGMSIDYVAQQIVDLVNNPKQQVTIVK